MTDPVVVVEVLSPTTAGRDAGAKLEDYFPPGLRVAVAAFFDE